jgi:hypothetical protein
MNGRFCRHRLQGKRGRIRIGIDLQEARFPRASKEVAMSKIVSVAILLAAAGFASALRAAPPSTPAPQQQSTASSSATPNNHSPMKPGDKNCLRDTGSLIPPKKGECLPVTGRSYSKQDIDRTGKTTIGPALEQLDPSITIQGRHGN